MDFYQRFLRPIFFALDAEQAHDAVMSLLEAGSQHPGLLRLTAGKPMATSPRCPRSIAGIEFPNPIGLAAGMDKNGIALPAWEALGFGFMEIGTITALAQPGNPKPRLFRYPEQHALINRLGFNNEGAESVATRLEGLRAAGRWPRIPVGLNIGKSKVTPAEQAHEDYLASFKRLHGLGDYFVINVSSPNTPGLRDLQSTEALGRIIRTLRDWEGTPRCPLFVKVAPDLAEEDLIAIVQLAETEQLAGLIATNTTLDHSGIPHSQDQTGGLSGVPVRIRSLAALRTIRQQTKIPVIACGGVSDAASAKERLDAGADLLQVYTAFIYQGPSLLRNLAASF
ncbi:MAG: quinone-dependent dihydroorotate dehydrogenase [Verrucomicrobia bacterium]|nr:quinone-dependent dihydroorotate dehydrogenase [Verrucomicrobiota bacterium]